MRFVTVLINEHDVDDNDQGCPYENLSALPQWDFLRSVSKFQSTEGDITYVYFMCIWKIWNCCTDNQQLVD